MELAEVELTFLSILVSISVVFLMKNIYHLLWVNQSDNEIDCKVNSSSFLVCFGVHIVDRHFFYFALFYRQSFRRFGKLGYHLFSLGFGMFCLIFSDLFFRRKQICFCRIFPFVFVVGLSSFFLPLCLQGGSDSHVDRCLSA
jgi:hypothetical protein